MLSDGHTLTLIARCQVNISLDIGVPMFYLFRLRREKICITTMPELSIQQI